MGLRNVPVTSTERRLRADKAARLEVARRLSKGAAHRLNNAFTALIGEASFLLEDRKDDALVVESCQSILAELERCTKLTRALLDRCHPNQGGSGEVEMVRLIREVGETLSETLGRENQLSLEAPDDILLVAGNAGELELLVLTLVQYAADHTDGPAKLTLSVSREPTQRTIRLSLAVQGSDHPDAAAEAILDPSRAADEITCVSLENANRIVCAHGGSREATSTGPDGWTARISLPALLDDDTAA